ncbi:virulence protein [Capnocytophaga granulosa]|jgi:virulence-associated protein 1|uniref:virulence protein n=1 Tax=Capnocytophaga granulosa TaxID=45242 RepID=UPI0028D1F150|nr:virulence protein [Capnocytophaga granulosa]
MYAIAFDMNIANLEEYYGKPYNNAYYEIAVILEKFTFYRIQGSTYITTDRDLGNLMLAIDALASIEWFANSVRDIRAFRIEDWSNLTKIVKKKATNQ